MAENISVAQISEAEKQSTLNKVVFSSFLGNFIEWFDYASYSYLATVIALVFFPSEDKMAATMSTFAVFALSFLVRPIGAIFWGNYGDKKGRKEALAISILLMSGATFLLGCIPAHAVIGVAAPALLLCCRLCQSFSASGEYAGASTFIAEYSPASKRGFYCSMVPASTATGLALGSLFATFMFTVWGADSQFVVDWGWRIPFWLAGPLGYITHWIRTQLEDSPVYEAMQAALDNKGAEGVDPELLAQANQAPIRTLLGPRYLKVTLLAFGSAVMNAIGFYAVLTFLPNYLETVCLYDAAKASTISTIVTWAYIAFVFISGILSDKLGRKKMLLIASAAFVILTLPAFMLMNSGNFVIILCAELIMALVLTINDGSLPSYLCEMFPTEVRFSGFALTFNCANAFFGGSCTYISLALVKATGSQLAPAFYIMAIAAIAFVCILLSQEASNKDLTEIH